MLHCLGNALATVSFSFSNPATALWRTLRLFLHQWTITRQGVERDLLFIGYLWVSSRIYYSSWTNNWLIVHGIKMSFLSRRKRNRWHQGMRDFSERTPKHSLIFRVRLERVAIDLDMVIGLSNRHNAKCGYFDITSRPDHVLINPVNSIWRKLN